MAFKIAVDTGGTFTDAVIIDQFGRQAIGKALTTSLRIFEGMREAIKIAAEELGEELNSVLSNADILIYGTTRATNAVVTGSTAKTAFITTQGFRDTLVLREGGKFNPHDYSLPYPDPYIPRRYTYEVNERIGPEGDELIPLNESQVIEVLKKISDKNFESLAVSLLWSISNPKHELIMGQLIELILPGIPYTLSHKLLPIVREYRRASATAIDASLKPLMQLHLKEMEVDLNKAGFKGDILVSTSVGGCQHVGKLIEEPIHTLKSGPAMAPVAGKAYCSKESLGGDVIVCDTGGTTFDVSLVRDGGLVYTRDSWIGQRWLGDLVAMSTVDVRSVGAGGGSIAWIDPGGLLKVGPKSSGAVPGPACYGQGGSDPTVTDAALVLGYIDPNYFVGGRIKLDIGKAKEVINNLANQLHKSIEEVAADIITVANELMIKAIHEITVTEGLNPAESIIVAGGGAAGLNIGPIAMELGCKKVILPKTASVLSACGMQFSDIVTEHTISLVTLSDTFNFEGVNAALEEINLCLENFCNALPNNKDHKFRKTFFVEARYKSQVWELDTPLPVSGFNSLADVDLLIEAFHQVHDRIYAVRDEGSQIECVNWKGRISVELNQSDQVSSSNLNQLVMNRDNDSQKPVGSREAYFSNFGNSNVPVYRGSLLSKGAKIEGPAIIEEPTTTVVVYPNMTARVTNNKNYILQMFEEEFNDLS